MKCCKIDCPNAPLFTLSFAVEADPGVPEIEGGPVKMGFCLAHALTLGAVVESIVQRMFSTEEVA